MTSQREALPGSPRKLGPLYWMAGQTTKVVLQEGYATIAEEFKAMANFQMNNEQVQAYLARIFPFPKNPEDAYGQPMTSKPNTEAETRQLERKISDFCMWGISEQAALEIVCKHTGKTPKEVRLYETEQERWYLYRNWTEPCWHAEVDNMRDFLVIDGLNYLMVVSKITGNVIIKGFMAH